MLQHGIDLHKRTLTIATLDPEGSLLKRSKMPARPRDLLRYLDALEGPHRAVVEATGSWYWVADLLRQHGIELKLAHARKLKAVASAKVKTDPIDALTLAQLLRVDLIPEAHMVSPELRGYRDLLRTRLRLVQKRTSAKNSISRTLERYNAQAPGQLESPRVCRRLHCLRGWGHEQIETVLPEVRERAVRLVLEHEREYASQWAAIRRSRRRSVARLRPSGTGSGRPSGIAGTRGGSDEGASAQRMKELERENRS